MTSEMCDFEDAVSMALASGQWNDALREHVTACERCAELELVWQSLRQAAKTEEAPLPAAGLIWWRSQLAEKREQAERAVAAIALMQKLAVALVMVAVVPFVWFWKPGVWLILVALSMVLATGAVLYGWARGRI
jgi:hypothetical protein